jgi:hypothetical protein
LNYLAFPTIPARQRIRYTDILAPEKARKRSREFHVFAQAGID